MTAEDDTTAQPDHATDRLSLTTLIVFGSISMPVSLLAIGVFMFLPKVYSSLGGISMVDAGFVILATRVWDFVTDPLIGWLSDKTRSRFGRRIPWMVLAWAPLTLAIYKVFLPPPDADVVYLAVWSFVLFTSGTALFMPYTAMGAELSTSYHQRSRIFLYRHLFSVVGTLIASGLFLIANKGGIAFFPERDALNLIGIVGMMILPIPIVATVFFVRERPVPSFTGPSVNWRDGMRQMLDNKPYLRILACYFANGIANAFPVALFFFYIKQVIERPDWEPIYLAVYFGAAILGTPLWMLLAGWLGKHVAWRFALILAIATFSTVPFLGSGDAIPFLFVAMVAGLTLGADLAMPASMLADVVDQDILRTGQQRTGIFFAVWAMAAKAAAALVGGLSLLILARAGFVPDMYNGDSALLVLAILFGVCPIVFKLLALGIVWRYPLTAERQAQLRAEILERQSA